MDKKKELTMRQKLQEYKQTKQLSLKSNNIPHAPKKKLLPEPKTVLKDSSTSILPIDVINSALAIVDTLKTPVQKLNVSKTTVFNDQLSQHDINPQSHPDSITSISSNSPIIPSNNDLAKINSRLESELLDLKQKHSSLLQSLLKKDSQISDLCKANQEFQNELKQRIDYGKEITLIQEKLLQEYNRNSRIEILNQELSMKNTALESEVADFNEIIQEMKYVATESEEKDSLIQTLQIKIETMEESILSLEVQLFDARNDSVKLNSELEQLNDAFECAQMKLSESKPMSSQQCQTEFSSDCQDNQAKKYASILKMTNSVLFQEIEEIQRKHNLTIREMQSQMKIENEKWQHLESSQTAMQRKIMEALEKAVNKNKQLKNELEIAKGKEARSEDINL